MAGYSLNLSHIASLRSKTIKANFKLTKKKKITRVIFKKKTHIFKKHINYTENMREFHCNTKPIIMTCSGLENCFPILHARAPAFFPLFFWEWTINFFPSLEIRY